MKALLNGDFGIALVGFVLLTAWQAPPLVVVAISALGGMALAERIVRWGLRRLRHLIRRRSHLSELRNVVRRRFATPMAIAVGSKSVGEMILYADAITYDPRQHAREWRAVAARAVLKRHLPHNEASGAANLDLPRELVLLGPLIFLQPWS